MQSHGRSISACPYASCMHNAGSNISYVCSLASILASAFLVHMTWAAPYPACFSFSIPCLIVTLTLLNSDTDSRNNASELNNFWPPRFRQHQEKFVLPVSSNYLRNQHLRMSLLSVFSLDSSTCLVTSRMAISSLSSPVPQFHRLEEDVIIP